MTEPASYPRARTMTAKADAVRVALAGRLTPAECRGAAAALMAAYVRDLSNRHRRAPDSVWTVARLRQDDLDGRPTS